MKDQTDIVVPVKNPAEELTDEDIQRLREFYKMIAKARERDKDFRGYGVCTH